ncbi:hypothetical protein IAT38_005095 [Cryptococcus sp. DSM 104549]
MVRFIVKDVRAAVQCVSSASVRRAMLSSAAKAVKASKDVDPTESKEKAGEETEPSSSAPIAPPVKPSPATNSSTPRYKLVAVTKTSSSLSSKPKSMPAPSPRLGKDFLKDVRSKAQAAGSTNITSRFREPFPSSYQGVSAFDNWITAMNEMLPKQSARSPQQITASDPSSSSPAEPSLPVETIGSRFAELRAFYDANCPEGSRKAWHLRVEEVKGARSAFIIYLVHRSRYQVALPFEILADGYHFPSDVFYFSGRDNHSDMQWIRNSLCIRELSRRDRSPELSPNLPPTTTQLIINALEVFFPGCQVTDLSFGKRSGSRPHMNRTAKEESAALLRSINRTGMGMVTGLRIKPHTTAFYKAHLRKLKRLEGPEVKYHAGTMNSAAYQLLADVISHCKAAK